MCRIRIDWALSSISLNDSIISDSNSQMLPDQKVLLNPMDVDSLRANGFLLLFSQTSLQVFRRVLFEHGEGCEVNMSWTLLLDLGNSLIEGYRFIGGSLRPVIRSNLIKFFKYPSIVRDVENNADFSSFVVNQISLFMSVIRRNPLYEC